MDSFFSKYGFLALEIVGGAIIIALIFSLFYNTKITDSESFNILDQSVSGANVSYDVTAVSRDDLVISRGIIDKGSEFDWRDYVEVKNTKGEDIENFITVEGSVDTSIVGVHKLTYELNYNGVRIVVPDVEYYVEEVI